MLVPKVSVVIPVYNVGPYIEKCVRTLFRQTLESLEFIFVDDKGSDDSFEILERIAKEYPTRQSQIKIIRHSQNMGVSQSRQDGVDVATGEYIIHCDPDDWVELDMYECLYKKAKECNADICGCDYWRESKNNTKYEAQNFILSQEDIFIAILNGQLGPFLWNRLIRRKFIQENNVFFDPQITLSEDAKYIIPLHWATKRVTSIMRPLYHYRMTERSITHKIGKSQIYSHIKVIKDISKFCNSDQDLLTAYNAAKARSLQALITQEEVYNPQEWLDETSDFPYKYFGRFRHKISPWLIRNKLFKLNFLLVKLFRKLTRFNI